MPQGVFLIPSTGVDTHEALRADAGRRTGVRFRPLPTDRIAEADYEPEVLENDAFSSNEHVVLPALFLGSRARAMRQQRPEISLV